MKGKTSSDWRFLDRIPHIVDILLQVNPTIWGISIWSLSKPRHSSDWRLLENSPLGRFFMLWSPTFWGINISCGSKTDTIKILSCLYHDLDDFEMKDKSFNLPHFVGFIMYDILQSEEFKIELNTNSSSDSRNPEKIPHFESF